MSADELAALYVAAEGEPGADLAEFPSLEPLELILAVGSAPWRPETAIYAGSTARRRRWARQRYGRGRRAA